ncbi:39S ribosomal protein L23, mitochondrial-like [Daphnia pulex]|uniref:39S ribosomal protein L23, mitochondrial-like n=1 Tax=Daphnia pulex TaxID=6669 RepID=UPI001EDF0EA5|nr:39S ribosomal protein L23, mitochondrial-like [Daphnia pulex]
MSTRIYPAFKSGSPKLRVFLPDFWMKLVKPSHNLLPNQVQFVVSSQMTKLDVKQYLEKIYNLPVVHVSTYNQMGKTKTLPNTYVTKENDEKIAFVTLHKDHKFVFPEIHGSTDIYDEQTNTMKQTKELYAQKTSINISKQGVPTWFSH